MKTPQLMRIPARVPGVTGFVTALVCFMALGSFAQSPSTDLPRVRISADGSHFVTGTTNARFVPWGFNYLGQFESLAEDDWDTEAGWQRIEKDFREMKRLGANVVRWHLQFPTFMKDAATPDTNQLVRLKGLLLVARTNGLYLDLTGLNCFRRDRIPDWYDALSEANRWRTQARFWSAVAETCRNDPAVFCYDFMNEPVINEPKPDEHPWVTGELGGFYFVQRISNKPDGRDSKDIAAEWVKQMANAIRQHDSEALLTVGVIPWAQVWPGAKPVFYAPQALPHLDFVSIHLYPGSGKLDQDLAALAAYELGKPLVIEETFPLSCSLAEFDQFISKAAPRVDGWISHYFGHTVEEHRNGAKPAGAPVADFLDYWTTQGRERAGTSSPTWK